MTAPIGITLGFEGVQKFQADGRIAAATVDNIGVSARQTAAALRGVPAQFTDIVTSIASGQNPMTVFIQQGGQLKDMFGGAGAAAKALGGYVVGLVNPFTAAAAAGVALALAYKQGSAEADAYTKAIALTGNAVGTTAAQLQNMAGRVDQVVGTQAKAAEVLAQFVGTGRVARAELEQFTATAIRMERSVGVAVKDTVKEFAELGKSPVEASKQLNERYNYLTAAVYEQIKALQEQGKAQEAGVVAQRAYDQAMARVADTMEEQLGTLERGWRAVTEAAKEGWDAMLNVGRKSTLSDEMGRVRTLIANKESGLDSYRDTRAGQIVVSEIDALKQKLSVMESDERMLRRGAEAQAERTRANKEAISAYDDLLKVQEKGLTKQQQMDKALAEYRKNLETTRAANPNSSALDPAAIARGEKAIRDQFKETSTGAPRAGESETAALKARADAAEKYLEQLRATGEEAKKLTAGEQRAAEIRELLNGSITGQARREKELALVQAERLGIAERATVTEQDRIKSIKESEAVYRKFLDAIVKTGDAYGTQADQQEAANASFGRGKVAIEQAALAQQELYAANEKAAGPWDPERIKAMDYAIEQQRRYVDALVAGEGKSLNARADELLRAAQEMSRLYEDEAQLAGLTSLERAKITAQRQIELKYAKELADIDKLTATTDAQILAKETARNKVLQAKRIEGEAAVAKAIQDDWTRTTDEINRSLTDALLRGFESGKGFAENLRDTIKNMFSTLVLRPVISAVMAPVAGMVGGVVNSGMSALGLASNLASGASLYSGLTSGTGLLGTVGGWLGLGSGSAATAGLITGAGSTGLGLTAGGGLGLSAGGGGLGLSLGSGAAAGAGGASTGMLSGLLSNPITLGLGAVALLGLIGKMGKGETRTGGQFGVAFDGQVRNNRRDQVYTYQGQQYDRDFSNGERRALIDGQAYRMEGDPVAQESAIRDAVSGTAKGIDAFLEALGSKARLSGFSAGLETSSKGRGGVFSGGVFEDGTTFGESGKGDNYAGTLYEKFSTNSPDFKQALADFTLDLKQSTVQALQSVSDIPETVKNMIKDVDAEGLSEEAANALLESINAQIVGVNQLTSAFEAMGMDNLAKMGFDAAAGLAEAAGGFDKLMGSLNTYYTNFYSSEEQRANVERELKKQLQSVGLELPDINAPDARARYRAMVERASNDMSEEGRKTYAILLGLAGAFASITTEAEDATQAINRQRESAYDALERAVAAERKVLQSQLDVARDVASTLDGLFGILHSNVRDLYGEVDSTRGMLASQGNDFITKALATAQKSGYLPDADKLADAISAARGGIDAGGYTSQFAQDRDRLVLAGKLAGLERITEKQLTDAQRTVKALEVQIEQGDQTLQYWRQQIDIASGMYEGILSVEDAVRELAKILGTDNAEEGVITSSGGGGDGTGLTGGPTQGRVDYGADEALTSFEKFKAWYTGLRNTADPNLFKDGKYKMPDWMRVSGFADDGSDEELFGQYQFFQNNRQYARDYEQIYTTGRTDYATDGSTLVKSDLSKMPPEVAAYFKSNRDALLSYEGMGMDPVLAYQLYKYGPEQFGLDRKQNNFTSWLQNNKWTADGIVANNNVAEFAAAPYADYRQNKYDPRSGNIVGMDGGLYTLDGRRVGTASKELLESTYGPGFKPLTNGRSSLYSSHVGDGDPTSYYTAIRTNLDKAINEGKSAQWIADAIGTTGASMQDVATAYGISVTELRENLRNGGATRIPQFAEGGFHSGGLRIVGERGWEVEATGPARIWNQDQLSQALGSDTSRLEALVAQLIAQVAALEASAQATASHTAGLPQMAEQFDSVTNGGNALRNQPVPA